MYSRALATACVLTLAGLTPTIGLAQSAEPPSNDPTTIDDIVVTAQRREQNLQDVPISVSVIRAGDLQSRGITGVSELTSAVPALNITRSSHQVAPFLRGVGSSAASAGNDPSVAVYIDGVYQPSPDSLLFAFNNIERVEVLRGPQGTLFGRNATGGLLQVVTREPSRDFMGRGSLGYANYDTVNSSAYVSGGGEWGAVDLGLIYNHQKSGWGDNLFTRAQAGPQFYNGQPVDVPMPNSEMGRLREFAARASAMFDLGENTTFRLTGIYTDNKTDQGLYRNPLPGARLLNGYAGIAGMDFHDSNTDVDWYSASTVSQVHATFEHDFEKAILRSITAYFHGENVAGIPFDATPYVANSGVLNSFTTAFSQEVQLLSAPDSPIDWIAGLYYLNVRAGYNPTSFTRGNIEPSFDRFGYQTTKSISAFGQVTVPVLDTTDITLGLRYTDDSLTASGYNRGSQLSTIPAPNPIFAPGNITGRVAEESTSQSRLTWRASLDHRFNPNLMGYASVTTGYKAGAYNVLALCLTTTVQTDCPSAAPPTRPETITSYEVGLKSNFDGGRVRLNTSAFYYDYKDLQVQAIVCCPQINVITNAAAAKIFGAELELNFRVTPQFNISSGVSLLKSEYVDFPDAVSFVPQAGPLFRNVSQIIPNASGNKLNRAPQFTFNGAANYTWVTSRGDVDFNLTYFYSGEFFWEVGNRLKEEPYHLVNGELSWQIRDDLRARVWGKNLLDEEYYTFRQASPDGDQGAPAGPLTFGVGLDFNF